MIKIIISIIGIAVAFATYFLTGADSDKEIIFTASVPMPIGPYSQAIKVGNTLYVSGQIGMTVQEKLDSASFDFEVMQALKNVEAIVKAGGMEMKHVVKATIYLKNIKNFNKVNDIYKLYFPIDPPARETVQVSALPKNAHFEISVIAVK